MVDRTEADDLFKLKSTTPKSKAEATDAAVREHLRQEADARTALTNKLRAARLAREAEGNVAIRGPESAEKDAFAEAGPKRAVPQRPRFRT